jgi:cell division protein FtsQ
LQQVRPEAEIWRRASPSPAPRPVLKAPRALAKTPLTRRLGPTRPPARLLLLVLALCASVALSAAVRLARGERGASLLAQVETWAQRAGLGLDQVVLIGHRYTTDTDIFEALALKRSRTMLTFDSQSAQVRLAELPWIARASIERVFPDRLEVRVTERTPVAVWARGERSVLIDESGRTLAPVAGDTLPTLPRLTGEGADTAAAGLLALLASAPDLQSRLAYAERIGDRRWSLRLKSGGAIQLPVEGEVQAVAKAAAVLAAGFTRAEIDVRASGRAIVRELPATDQAQLSGSSGPLRPPTDRL